VIVIAYNPTVFDQLFGFMVYEKHSSGIILHYAYTKAPYRRLGIQKEILNQMKAYEEPIVFYTHRSYASDYLVPKLNAIYHPYLVYE
jgi:hypothetical protein